MYYCKECGELVDDPLEDGGFLICTYCGSIELKFLDEDKYKLADEGY